MCGITFAIHFSDWKVKNVCLSNNYVIVLIQMMVASAGLLLKIANFEMRLGKGLCE